MPNRCGIGPFTTGPNDPMISACEWHDKAYIANKLHGGEKIRSIIDREFYCKMKNIASSKKSLSLRFQSVTYYVLARLFGWIPWYFHKSNGK